LDLTAVETPREAEQVLPLGDTEPRWNGPVELGFTNPHVANRIGVGYDETEPVRFAAGTLVHGGSNHTVVSEVCPLKELNWKQDFGSI